MDAYEVIDTVCRHFGLERDDVIAFDKSGYVSMARNFCYYFLHFEGDKLSVAKIAAIFGRNERGIKKILTSLKYLVATQKRYSGVYEDIKSSF